MARGGQAFAIAPQACPDCGKVFQRPIHFKSHLTGMGHGGYAKRVPRPAADAPRVGAKARRHPGRIGGVTGGTLKSRRGRPRNPVKLPPEPRRVVGAPDDPTEPMTVTLQMRHDISGIAYGPGVLTVPTALGRELVYAERKVIASEAELREERAFIIGARGIIPVPYNFFNQFWTNPAPNMVR
jgi:hypothetical protein